MTMTDDDIDDAAERAADRRAEEREQDLREAGRFPMPVHCDEPLEAIIIRLEVPALDTVTRSTIDRWAADVLESLLHDRSEFCAACSADFTGEAWHELLALELREARGGTPVDADGLAEPAPTCTPAELAAFDAELARLIAPHVAQFIDEALAGLADTFGPAAILERLHGLEARYLGRSPDHDAAEPSRVSSDLKRGEEGSEEAPPPPPLGIEGSEGKG